MVDGVETPVGLRGARVGGESRATGPSWRTEGRAPACVAPTKGLYLFPDGYARSCCVNTVPLGNVRESSLLDIWRGATRRRIVERIAAHDFSMGCETCGNELAVEGRSGSYPEQFDRFGPAPDEEATQDWPSFMGFYLSNACNLQCIQCNGESSSAIRLHRERRPALPRLYGDEFFEDLREFIPHLEHASFVGGEPLLAPETFRVWDLLGDLAPGLECTVVTNGTIHNRRVEEGLERLRASIVVSMDAVTPARFEAIRVGASFATVLENLERFAAYTRRIGTTLSINHCLMPDNVDEFTDLLLFAEERGIRVDVSVVREPAQHSLAALPGEDLRRVHRDLANRAEAVLDRLALNRDVLVTELARLDSWARCPDDDRPSVLGSAPYTILMFRRDGDGPSDGRSAIADLVELAPGSEIHEVRVAPGDVVADCSETFEAWLGLEAGELLGRPVMAVHEALVSAFGPMASWRELSGGPDRSDARAVFRDREVHLSMVAMRDEAGRADQARMLFVELPAAGAAMCVV